VRADAGTRTPDPLLTMERRERTLTAAPTPLGKRIWPGVALPSPRCGCGPIGADADGFGPKWMSWGQPAGPPLEFDDNGFPVTQRIPSFVTRVARLLSRASGRFEGLVSAPVRIRT
jgi:hypothetical protein